ncbi:hypothetical protein [Kocuria tytonis]|uniref:YtxH domain-containing protein n=1 Tax=Kocuria tytonis TaxID=2054280 RepID=A0A495A8J1_9MICC|nr:hypothetical protein [Kocuria tytonis]RKQ36349.1 hypothetical protein C1C97_001320 [Kocuria tytonis]
MGMWSKLALLAAGALVGGAATRVASDPAAREAIGRAVQGAPESTAVARTANGDVAHRPRSGAVATLRSTARRFGAFAARVRTGMDEREAQLREQFGVRTPVDHTANHPDPGDSAVPPAGVPWHSVTSHGSASGPEDPRRRVIDHDPSEGNER